MLVLNSVLSGPVNTGHRGGPWKVPAGSINLSWLIGLDASGSAQLPNGSRTSTGGLGVACRSENCNGVYGEEDVGERE
jgi:hypothetical protein